jgi:hypothetical protein
MNQTVKKRASSFRKRRASLQQCLSSITSRKRYLKIELVELGVSSPLGVGNMMEYYLTNKNLN